VNAVDRNLIALAAGGTGGQPVGDPTLNAGSGGSNGRRRLSLGFGHLLEGLGGQRTGAE